MDSPFIYDKYVTGKNFIGRKTECGILSNLIRQGEHAALIDPPKTGKMSLIQQTLFNLRLNGTSFRVGQFSLQNIRTIESFLLRYGSTLIRAVATTPAEYAAIAAEFLGGSHFVFDPERFATADEVLSLNWELEPQDIDALLRLPWRLSGKLEGQLILILDQWQDILLLDDPERILRPLEKIVREEARGAFSFLFCGDRVNAMKSIFQDTRCWLHRRVEVIRLSRVDEREVAEHIVKGFLSSGKVIDRELLVGACRLFQGNLWYLNHFAAVCDAKSKGYIMEPVLIEALDSILSIHELRFCAIMDDLTTHQVNLLKAIIDGHVKFSSSQVVREYGLNSSANVKRVKDALCKKEIITFGPQEEPVILDPLFEYWVRKFYFEKKD